VATVLTPIGLWVRAVRWRYLFPPGAPPPALVAGVMIGYMVNNVLPLRAGEVARVWVVARRWGHGFWTVLATLIVERVLDGLAIVAVLGVLVLLVDVPLYLRWGAALMLAVNVAGVIVLAAFAVAPARSRAALGWATRRWPRLRGVALDGFERFVRGLEGIRTAAHLLPLIVWTLAVWALPLLIAWAMLRAVHLSLPWLAPLAVLAFLGVGVSIPSAPGYIGVFHAAAVLALGVFGVAPAESLGYALLLHAVQFVPVTLIGWVFLLREHLSLADATHAAPTEEEPEGPRPAPVGR
jgi:uncharacterized membrane protein YbhN (UPF0104 family)